MAGIYWKNTKMSDMRKYIDLINQIEQTGTAHIPAEDVSGYGPSRPNILSRIISEDITSIIEGDVEVLGSMIDFTVSDATSIDQGTTKLTKLKSIVEMLGSFVQHFEYFMEGDILKGTLLIYEKNLNLSSPELLKLHALYEKINSYPWDTRIKSLGFGDFTKEEFVNIVSSATPVVLPNDMLHTLNETSLLSVISNNHFSLDSVLDIPITIRGNNETWLISGAVSESIQRIVNSESKGVILEWDGKINAIDLK